MPETEANPGKPPRFPYVATLLCAACVGMAGYLWMRYSYAWDVEPEQMWTIDRTRGAVSKWARLIATPGSQGMAVYPDKALVGRYVRLRCAQWHDALDGLGISARTDPFEVRLVQGESESGWWVLSPTDGGLVPVRKKRDSAVGHGSATFLGRVVTPRGATMGMSPDPPYPCLNITASRFHGASIAGLVVGAMGVFVFSVALRQWFRERRAVMAQEASQRSMHQRA